MNKIRPPERRFKSVRDMTPYFQELHRSRPLCPKCKKATMAIEPSLNPNVGMARCRGCGHMQGIQAPLGRRVHDQWCPPRQKNECVVISFENARRATAKAGGAL